MHAIKQTAAPAAAAAAPFSKGKQKSGLTFIISRLYSTSRYIFLASGVGIRSLSLYLKLNNSSFFPIFCVSSSFL